MPIELPRIIQRIVLDSDFDSKVTGFKRSLDDLNTSVVRSNRETDNLSKSLDDAGDAARSSGRDHDTLGRATENLADSARRAGREAERAAEGIAEMGARSRNTRRDNDSLRGSLDQLIDAAQATSGVMALFGNSLDLLKIPTLIAAAGPAASALGALGAAVFGVTGAVSQMVGVVGAAPGAFAALATAAVGLRVGFAGIGDALSAAGVSGGGGGGGGRSAADIARDIEQATYRLEDAQFRAGRTAEDYGRAQEAASRRLEDANRRVTQAEQRLSDAQAARTRIQTALTEATRLASEELEDLAFASAGAALAEERAQIRLEESRRENAEAVQQLAEAQSELANASTDEERAAAAERVVEVQEAARDAALALREAELDLQMAQDRRQDTQLELNRAETAGIDGTREMVGWRADAARAAQEEADASAALEEAKRAVTETEWQNARALEDAQRAQVAANRAVEEAARALAEAGEAGGGGGGGVDKFREAMDKLSPSARAVVEALIAMRPEWDAIKQNAQESLFAPLVGSMDHLRDALPVVGGLLSGMNAVLGDLMAQLVSRVTAPQFLADIQSLSTVNEGFIRALGEGLLDVFDALVNIGVTAAPMLGRVSDSIGSITDRFLNFTQAGRDDGSFAAFFDRAYDRLQQVVRILGDLGGGLMGVFRAATPLGDSLLGSMEGILDRFNQWTNSDEGQARLRRFFDSMRPVISEIVGLVGDLGRMFGRLAEDNAGGAAGLLGRLRTEFLPILDKLLQSASGGLLDKVLDIALHLANAFANVSTGALEVYADVLGSVAQALDWLIESVPGFDHFIAALIVFGTAGKSFDNFATGVSSLRDGLGIFRALAVRMGILTTATIAQAGATNAAAVSTTAFNTALLTNPVVLITAAIIALGAAVVLLYRNNEDFRDFVRSAWSTIQNVFTTTWRVVRPILDGIASFFVDTLVPAVRRFIDFIRDNWQGVLVLLTGPIGAAVAIVITHFDSIRNGIGSVVGFISDVWGRLVDVFGPGISAALDLVERYIDLFLRVWSDWSDNILNIVEVVWDAIAGVVRGAMRIVQGIIETITGVIQGDWDRVWTGIQNIVSGAWRIIRTVIEAGLRVVGELMVMGWEVIRDSVSVAWDAMVDFAMEFPGRVVSALSGFGSFIWSGIASGWEFIRASLSTVIDAYVDFWVRLPGRIVSGVGNLGQFIWDAISNGFDFLRTSVRGVLDEIVAFFVELPRRTVEAIGDVGTYLSQKGRDLIQGLSNGVLEVWATVSEFFLAIPRRAGEFIGDVTTTLFATGRHLLDGLYRGMIDAGKSVWEWFERFPSNVLRAVGSIGELLVQVGKDLITGLFRGMRSIPVPDLTPGFDLPGFGSFLADGGKALAGRAHIVGEEGPELFIPNTTGTVVSNAQVADVLDRILASPLRIANVPADAQTQSLLAGIKAITPDQTAAPGRSGPAVNIEEANFYDGADLDLFMAHAEFAVQARRF